MAEFQWTNQRNKAAELIAADELTDPEICSQIGVASRQTLLNWRRHPEFAARVQSHVDAFREATLKRGIALRERRVAALDDRWRRMRRVIEERATSEQMRDVPGGQTGLLCHTVKGVGRGDDFQLVDLYEVDTGLLRELREHEKQSAQELGQWTEKKDLTSGGQPFKVYAGFDPDEV
jgi:hypothetical protein